MAINDRFQELILEYVCKDAHNEELPGILSTLRQVSSQKLGKRVVANDITREDNVESLLDIAATGFMGIDIPKGYGGFGGNYLDYLMGIVTIGQYSGDQSTTLDIEISHVVQSIIRSKTTVNGGINYNGVELVISSFAQTEEKHGSDAQNLECTLAEDEGNKDNVIVNGRKIYITNGAKAGFTIVNTNEAVGENGKAIIQPHGEPRLTSIIVENNSKGHIIGQREITMGHTSSVTAERAYNNVSVSKSNIIGERGKGFKYFMQGLDEGRYGISASVTGGLAYVLDRTRERVLERYQFGKPIIEFPQVREKLAFLEQVVLASKLMLYNGAMSVDKKLPISYHAAITKHFVTKYGSKASEDAIQVFGGEGYLAETGIERCKRDTILGLIGEGTDDIIKMVISRNLLKNGKQTDEVSNRLSNYSYETGSEEERLYKGIKLSEEIVSSCVENLKVKTDAAYFNMLGDMDSLVEATKALFDFALVLKSKGQNEWDRVFAMAQRMGMEMANKVALNSNQFLLRNEQEPMYDASKIYINNRIKLEDRIVKPYLPQQKLVN